MREGLLNDPEIKNTVEKLNTKKKYRISSLIHPPALEVFILVREHTLRWEEKKSTHSLYILCLYIFHESLL